MPCSRSCYWTDMPGALHLPHNQDCLRGHHHNWPCLSFYICKTFPLDGLIRTSLFFYSLSSLSEQLQQFWIITMSWLGSFLYRHYCILFEGVRTCAPFSMLLSYEAWSFLPLNQLCCQIQLDPDIDWSRTLLHTSVAFIFYPDFINQLWHPLFASLLIFHFSFLL